MKYIYILLLIILNYSNTQSENYNDYVQDELIVKFNTFNNHNNHLINTIDQSEFDILNKKFDATSISLTGNKRLENTYLIKYSENQDLDILVDSYMQTGLFEFVEPNYIGKGGGEQGNLELIPNDQYFSRQYGLYNDGSFSLSPSIADADTDMELAWDIERGDSTIIVAVLDAGIRFGHPEFQNRLWQNNSEIINGIDDDGNGFIDDIFGWDFINKDNDPTDDHGHGTNVAGIIGANANNKIGYAGVDWFCKLMIGKILDNNNRGSLNGFAEGVYYAVDNGADVINMSVGGSFNSQLFQEAIQYAYDNGVVVVACMMNENNSVIYYPAGYETTIAVGSTNPNDERTSPFFWRSTSGSNFGQHIDVVAPGNYIYGLSNNSDTNYNTYWGGTSQATPLVAGLCALLLAQNPDRTPDDIKTIIRNSSVDQVGKSFEDTPGFDIYHGYGRVNAYQALTYSVSSIEDKYEESNVILFPNPVTNIVNIETEKSISRLIVTNMFGQEIFQQNDFNNVNSRFINIKKLPKGIYLISIFDEKNNIIDTKKIIKE